MFARFSILFLVILNAFNLELRGQELQISGSVYSFHSEKVMLLKKASKNLGFEGPTSDVRVTVTGNGYYFATPTDISGNYLFSIPAPGEFTVTISKQGYSELKCVLNYSSAGSKTAFSLLSFVIRKDDQSKNDLGVITITESGTLNYQFSQAKSGNQDVIQSNKILLEKAVALNNSSKQDIISHQSNKKRSNSNGQQKTTQLSDKQSEQTYDSASTSKTQEIVRSFRKVMNDSLASLADAQKQIEKYKQMLTSLQPTDPNYEYLFNQIKSAEAELSLKEKLLKAQGNELSQAKKVMTFMILVLVIAAGLIGFMIYYIREKKKFNLELSSKNNEITKINTRLLSSIKYASVIQANLLMDRSVLKEIFENSFLFYQPKDYLSGDFYWFGTSGKIKIIISADCTGHGVPGALLTVLGHGILEQLIEKKKLSTPSAIINELNLQLNKAFSDHNLMEYGIELTVLCLDPKGTEAKFASNGHGIYKNSGDELIRYLPVINKPSKPNGQIEYLDMSIDFKKGDCFFLMSDGYCDQFKMGKPEKYNIPRFEKLLDRVCKNNDISVGEKILKEEFNEWKGSADQTDDVLVIGLRV